MRLHEQVKDLNRRISVATGEINSFRAYLDGPKFRGYDSAGMPADYINVREVSALLLRLRFALEGEDI